jgi:hypothetical protein
MAEAGALATSGLPDPGDYVTRYGTGQAYVRRVLRQNVWIIYRFDAERVYVMRAEGMPPVPVDE